MVNRMEILGRFLHMGTQCRQGCIERVDFDSANLLHCLIAQDLSI